MRTSTRISRRIWGRVTRITTTITTIRRVGKIINTFIAKIGGYIGRVLTTVAN